MTGTTPDDGGDDATGYRRPPKAHRFRKGQSGNPAGRPPGRRQAAPPLPVVQPTRKILQADAGRPVTVRDGDNRYEIPTTEAVIRSLGRQAMQGGVLAARTYLAYQMEEDAREEARRRETFDYWRDYVTREQAAIARARPAACPCPEPLPHPDDIVFDYTDLSVRFTGPCDEQELAVYLRSRERAGLFLELMLFHGIDTKEKPVRDGTVVSFYQFLLLLEQITLPPRLARPDDALLEAMSMRATGPRRLHEKWLRTRIREVGFAPGQEFDVDFDPCRPRPPIDLAKFGARVREGRLEVGKPIPPKARGRDAG